MIDISIAEVILDFTLCQTLEHMSKHNITWKNKNKMGQFWEKTTQTCKFIMSISQSRSRSRVWPCDTILTLTRTNSWSNLTLISVTVREKIGVKVSTLTSIYSETRSRSRSMSHAFDSTRRVLRRCKVACRCRRRCRSYGAPKFRRRPVTWTVQRRQSVSAPVQKLVQKVDSGVGI